MRLADDTFDVVFCRDLIHHLRDRSKMVSEMFRICKKGGRIVLIESNGCNPLIFLFSCLVPAENDVRYITPAYLRRLLTDKKILSWDYAEPLSLWRLIFHYKYGLPKLATYSIVQRMYVLLEKILACLIPKKLWGYMIVVMQKDTVSGHK
jgi:SAM-dependent methyltransferase